MDTITCNRKRGFTLIELLTVITIMAVMMGIAVAAWIDWGRGAGMRGSSLDVQSSITLARQWAITHRVRTQYIYGNTNVASIDRGFYVICTNNSSGIPVPVGNVSLMAENVVFTNTPPAVALPTIVFKLDGTCSGSGATDQTMDLLELNRATPLRSRITIYPLTGRCKIADIASASSGGGGGGRGGGR